MITRSQAEALLTLAESLEACERLNIGVVPAFDGSQNLQFLDSSSRFAQVSALTGKKVRNAVTGLVPSGQRSGRQPDPPNYQEFPK